MRRMIIGIIATVLLVGVILSAYILGVRHNHSTVDTASANYPLLAKRILIDNPNDSFVNFSVLRTQLNQYFTDNNVQGSLYFEYLPTGTSIKIDGDKQEVGASLLKVPAAMELYKAFELGKINIDKTVTTKSEWLDSAYGDLYKKGPGYELTLRDAAKTMLENSDNTALNIISYNTNGLLKDTETPVNALDIAINVGSQSDHYTISIGARDYSSILKCLYFSCYLNKEHSQELLNYLSNTQFTSRLPAGVTDKTIPIAHKIGNYAQDTQSDCGIVYLTKRNYLLCVMIKGQDNQSTDKKIAELSKITYDFVSQKQ